jgi:hypothetical protein
MVGTAAIQKFMSTEEQAYLEAIQNTKYRQFNNKEPCSLQRSLHGSFASQ